MRTDPAVTILFFGSAFLFIVGFMVGTNYFADAYQRWQHRRRNREILRRCGL